MNDTLPREISSAIKAAAKELEEDHSWYFGDDGGSFQKGNFEDTEFFQIFAKHLSSVIDMEVLRKARIAALKEELAVLEKESNLYTFNRNENLRCRARLQVLWKWIQDLNIDMGVEPPEHFFDWFDENGVPV